MNEKQAVAKGYSFNGAYSRDKEVIKIRIEDEKKKGNKAVLVTIPVNKLSRSANRAPGYSMYVIKSEANKKAEAIENATRKVTNLELVIEKHRQELSRLENELIVAYAELNAI